MFVFVFVKHRVLHLSCAHMGERTPIGFPRSGASAISELQGLCTESSGSEQSRLLYCAGHGVYEGTHLL